MKTGNSLFLILAACLGTVAASPPPAFLTKPEPTSRWLAPRVLAQSEPVGDFSTTTVRWFDDLGNVTKELRGTLVHATSEYIWEPSPAGMVVHGLSGKWQIVLSLKEGSGVRADGERLVHSFQSAEGVVAADIYEAGRLVATVGPFMPYKGWDSPSRPDGSMAILAWKTPERQNLEVVIVRPDGKISFRADCGADAGHPFPLDGGRGVILSVEGREEPPARFTCVHANGKRVPLALGPNAEPVTCVPPGDDVLFRISLGDDEQFKLIDCSRPEVLWEIPRPVAKFRTPTASAATSAFVVDKMLVFVGLDLAAVDPKSGEVISRWQPNFQRANPGHLVQQGNRRYLVTDEKCVDWSVDDITEKKNGWQ